MSEKSKCACGLDEEGNGVTCADYPRCAGAAPNPPVPAAVRERLARVLKSSDKNTPRHVAALARALGLRPYQKRVPYATIADALLASAPARGNDGE